MYKSPFGSLFSSDDSAPKPDPKPIAKTSPSDALGKRTAELKKSKVINPNIKSLETKKPFDNTTPQFKSLTTMHSDDMRVIAEQSKILVEKNKQKLAALSRRLKEIKLKTRAAKVYRDVLIQFRQLPEVDKQILAGWMLKHSAAIKKLNSARKLVIIKKNSKESVQALDAEIMHWGNLLQLKKAGVDIQGKVVLKNYRPVEKRLQAAAAAAGELPAFAAKVLPKSEIYRIKSGKPFARSHELGSLGATDEALKSLSKEAATKKKSYKELFVEDLPGRDAILELQNVNSSLGRLRKKTEKTIVRAKELDWRIEKTQDLISAEQRKYDKVQETLGQLTLAMSKDPQTARVIHSLGILLEARPERFLSSPTLLDAAKRAFKRLSQLGSDTPVEEEATPEKEVDALLNKASEESAAELKELEIRQNTLERLKAEVEGKPLPPLILLISDEPMPPPPSKARKTAGTINKLLPWAAGLFLFMKLLEA
jgi:hypothetical protein